MKNWSKRIAALLLVLLAVAACAQADTRTFTDSLGREVVLDQQIDRVAVSGPSAQIYVFALAPDKLVGVSSKWDNVATPFIGERYQDLPVLGQLYGGKGELNLETLLAAAPQVVVDVGAAKDGAKEDLDALSEQTGIPFVHISAHKDNMHETYAMLGELLGMEAEAAVLSDYCKKIYDRTMALVNRVEKAELLYVTTEANLAVIAKDAYQAEVIDMLAENIAVVDKPSGRGTGNEVDMEQILVWNPELVIFSNHGLYESAPQDPLWQTIPAIANNRYYEVPVGPYNWLGFPPGAQRLLGMLWLGELLYPEETEYDLYEEVKAYFDLFYHCDLSREAYDGLMKKALPR